MKERKSKFTVIQITEERMKDILPEGILNSELSHEAKLTLAAIINYHYCLPVVKNAGYLAISNHNMSKSIGKSMSVAMAACKELTECELIIRNGGKPRQKNEVPMASEYWVNWENLMKPLKKPDPIELMRRYLVETSKTLEKPISTPNAIPIPIPKPISKSEPKPKPEPDPTSKTVLNYTVLEDSISKEDDYKVLLREGFKQWSEKVNKDRMSRLVE